MKLNSLIVLTASFLGIRAASFQDPNTGDAQATGAQHVVTSDAVGMAVDIPQLTVQLTVDTATTDAEAIAAPAPEPITLSPRLVRRKTRDFLAAFHAHDIPAMQAVYDEVGPHPELQLDMLLAFAMENNMPAVQAWLLSVSQPEAERRRSAEGRLPGTHRVWAVFERALRGGLQERVEVLLVHGQLSWEQLGRSLRMVVAEGKVWAARRIIGMPGFPPELLGHGLLERACKSGDEEMMGLVWSNDLIYTDFVMALMDSFIRLNGNLKALLENLRRHVPLALERSGFLESVEGGEPRAFAQKLLEQLVTLRTPLNHIYQQLPLIRAGQQSIEAEDSVLGEGATHLNVKYPRVLLMAKEMLKGMMHLMPFLRAIGAEDLALHMFQSLMLAFVIEFKYLSRVTLLGQT